MGSIILANNQGFQSCPKCDHETAPGVVICWWCGYCLDPHILELAKSAKKKEAEG